MVLVSLLVSQSPHKVQSHPCNHLLGLVKYVVDIVCPTTIVFLAIGQPIVATIVLGVPIIATVLPSIVLQEGPLAQ